MSILEERLEEDLRKIRDGVAAVAADVEVALRRSQQAISRLDKDLANQIILGDFPINRTIRKLDRQCHYFIARHLPSAGHLRFISSVMRMNIALERIGDYAVTIAREAKTITQPLGDDAQSAFEQLCDEAFSMFKQAVQSFNERNADLARGTMGYAYQVDHTFSHAFNMLLKKGKAGDYEMTNLFGLLIVFNRLERVSDQAKNICEETVFAVTGETKRPKVYRILFLEKEDDCRSQMAVSIAAKAYSEQGKFSSGGQAPASGVNPACATFMADHGHDLTTATPKKVDEIEEGWKDNHVIVSLDGAVEDYIDEIPFQTIALKWDIPAPPPVNASDEDEVTAFESIFRALSAHIGDLMHMLHGEEAL